MAKGKRSFAARRPRRKREAGGATQTRVRNGRTERRQLNAMENGRVFCSACQRSHDFGGAPEADWRCPAGHGGVWFVDEFDRVPASAARDA